MQAVATSDVEVPHAAGMLAAGMHVVGADIEVDTQYKPFSFLPVNTCLSL